MLAGSIWRFHDHSKSLAVHGVPSDHLESLRILNVHTEPSALEETFSATYGTGWKSALNFRRPDQSACDAAAVEVLVEIVARRVVLNPAAPAIAQMLVLGELLAGARVGAADTGRGIEAGGAQGGEAAGDLEEISTADASGAQALGQQIHLRIGDAGTPHW